MPATSVGELMLMFVESTLRSIDVGVEMRNDCGSQRHQDHARQCTEEILRRLHLYTTLPPRDASRIIDVIRKALLLSLIHI